MRRLGLRSAIVYHDADAGTPAVSMADTAIAISGRTPIAAYLDIAPSLLPTRRAPTPFIRVMDLSPRMLSSPGP
ncbi:hypothetical protein [Bradyrhizobium sp. CSA112]|uniref:hypothetical protein n=1 Tax=Bradyrhizobium sp. CSA112 TaxID=2699170 RepID=UPI0023AF64E0|nr:hypothetical protein [Bradyrhizobium sp. CSA112]